VPLSSSPRGDRMRTFSRTSRADGSAYGYGGGYRRRLTGTATIGTRKDSMSSSLRTRRRGSNAGLPASASEPSELNFAQRLLLANENAVTNIADLWVAAAMNVDNEDPFQSDTELASETEYLEEELVETNREESSVTMSPDGSGRPEPIPGPSSHSPAHRLSTTRRPSGLTYRPEVGSPRRQSMNDASTTNRHMSFSTSQSRRFSSTVPAIFAHPGVRTPAAVIDAQQLLARFDEPPSLAPIIESRSVSHGDLAVDSIPEKMPSLASQLPLVIIAQYGFLALHSTTHDQIFMSYLVSFVPLFFRAPSSYLTWIHRSDYAAGGLNLNAGRFAQLSELLILYLMHLN
jgi:hypothetical protein